MLVLVALLLGALFGLAGLIIDLGLARLAHQQMRIAAEGAALEALRFDQQDPSAAPLTAAEWDQRRRERAIARVGQYFDDDLMATPDSDPLQAGAGPLIGLTGGTPMPGDRTLLAGQFMTVARVPEERVYKPQHAMQLNLANDPVGDIVFGRFGPNAEYDPTHPYSRLDFAPDPQGQTVLVRLRRTAGTSTDAAGFDQIDGTSSTGPTMPFLFGRGVLLSPSSRAAGVALRATAVADAAPAMSVGPVMERPGSSPPEFVAGLAPFALMLTYWNDAYWASAAEETLTVQGSDLVATRLGGAIVGKVGAPVIVTQVLSLGQSWTFDGGHTALIEFAPLRAQACYVPLVDQAGTIVGFGHAQWPDGMVNEQLRVLRPLDASSTGQVGARRPYVASGNATATLTQVIPAGTDVPSLLTDHGSITDALLSPVLRR